MSKVLNYICVWFKTLKLNEYMDKEKDNIRAKQNKNQTNTKQNKGNQKTLKNTYPLPTTNNNKKKRWGAVA